MKSINREYNVVNRVGEKYYLYKHQFKDLFIYDKDTKEIYGLNFDNKYISTWNQENVEKVSNSYLRLEQELGKEVMDSVMQKFFLFRDNKNLPLFCKLQGIATKSSTLKEMSQEILPRTNAFTGLCVYYNNLTDHVGIIAKDEANGLGTLDSSGYAGTLPKDASSAYTAEKLLSLYYPQGKLIGGGIAGKGDFVIKNGNKEFYFEVKDISYDKIYDDPQKFNARFQERVNKETKNAQAILIYKGPFMSEETANIIHNNLQVSATDSKKEFLLFYKEKIEKIVPQNT